jgi:hypothetical protein
MREVFLSHASRDNAKARRLKNVLTGHGISVWFSSHHIRGAQQWQDEIGQALERCDWFMVLLTPNAIRSMWVEREVKHALKEKRYKDHIIPLLFKKCDPSELSWVLPQIQTIDFTKNYWKGCEQLLRIWNISLKKPVRKKRRKKETP